MKKSKKMLIMIPILGLFLSGCTFQEGFEKAKTWVQDLFNGGKKEEKSSDDPTPSVDPTPGPGPVDPEKTVNPKWPTADIASFVSEELELTDTVPGFTGESDAIELDDYNGCITIKVPTGSTASAVISAYAADLLKGGYSDEGPDKDGDAQYLSQSGDLNIVLSDGADYNYSGYVIVWLQKVIHKETSTTFPKTAVDTYLASLEITETYPVPSGTSFEYYLSDDDYCYYIVVNGGSSASYMEQLTGFTKGESHFATNGYYDYTKGDLEVDVWPSDTTTYQIAIGINFAALMS